MRQDQYELKGAVLEAPLEWQGLRLAPRTGGRPGYGAGGDGPAAVPAAADRTERVRRPGRPDQAGERPPPAGRRTCPEREGPETLAAVWYGPGGGGGGPTRHPGGLLQRVRRPAGGLCRCGGEPGTLGWAALGEKLLDYVQAVRREEGDLAEKAEPFQTLPSWTDRETGELLRALLRALCEGSGGRGSAQG